MNRLPPLYSQYCTCDEEGVVSVLRKIEALVTCFTNNHTDVISSE